ncbi:histidine phosphotransferase family protein [Sphingomonas vulcanisoli]|nr:histidine phosphotransferase family protein [Sphingomonas vulcanisoli]
MCSRLCHDLLSPVGALNNGLELLADEDDPALRKEYLSLLADGARASAEKLKFFRLAFGAAGGFGDRIDAGEVRASLDSLAGMSGKVAFGWVADCTTLDRSATRIVLNLGLIALDALVRGGRLDVGLEGGEIVVRAEGARLVLDGEVRRVLAGEALPTTSRTIGAVLASTVAERDGRTLLLQEEDGVLLLGASRV